jgi:parallel beta-helix repeat protein
MREAKLIVGIVVSLFVLGSLGISAYAVADPKEDSRPILDVPDWARDLVPTDPGSPPLHREVSMGGEGGSESSEGQGQPEGGGGIDSDPDVIIGDWTCHGNFWYQNIWVRLIGNLNIAEDCNIYLDNVLFTVAEELAQPVPKDIKITVERDGVDRGYFEVAGGSEIKKEDTRRYEFEVNGKLKVLESKIHDFETGLRFLEGSIGDIDDSEVYYSDTHVIYSSNPSSLDVIDSDVYGGGQWGSSGHGIYVNEGENSVYLYDTDVHDNDDYGIYVYGSGPGLIPIPIPQYVPGQDFGYFIWVDDDYWQLRYSTVNGTSATFNGTVTMPSSNHSFNETVTYGGGSRNYAVEESATFDLWLNGSHIDEDLVFVGKYEQNPISNPFGPVRLGMIIEHQSNTYNNWGGIYVENSSPIIRGNDMYSNTQYGVSVKEASPAIDDNDITNNNYGIYAVSDSSHSYSPMYSPIVVENYVSVSGAPPSHAAGMYFRDYINPRIRYNSIYGNFLVNAYALGLAYNTKGLVVGNNITRVATANTNTGIFCYTSCSPTVYDNNVDQFSFGIWISYYSAAQVTWNDVDNAWGGIYLYSTGYSDVTIEDNHVEDSGSGIDLRSSTADVLDNTLLRNNYGIVTRLFIEDKTTSPLIKDNTVDDSNVFGIHAYDRSTPTIKHNVVTDSTGSGICACPDLGEIYIQVGQTTIGGSADGDKNTLSGNGKWGIELAYNKPTNWENLESHNIFSGNTEGKIIQYWWATFHVTYKDDDVEDAWVRAWETDNTTSDPHSWESYTDQYGMTSRAKLREYYIESDGTNTYCTESGTLGDYYCTPHLIRAEKQMGGKLRIEELSVTMDQNRPDVELEIK